MAEQREFMTGVLRSDIELIRGEPWLLFDPQADAYFKFDSPLIEVLSCLTESMPVSRFLDLLHANGREVSKDQLLNLLIFLRQNSLLEPEYGQVALERAQRDEIREKSTFLRFATAYLFFRLPPWRPERFFKKFDPYLEGIASRPVIVALLLPSILGYLLILREWESIRTAFLDSLSWVGLAKYFVAILVMKLVHEASHSLVAIHFRCRVRGIGIGFMIFYPRLYTDTTDSWRLPRRKRLLIDAGGIISELLLGGITALLWCYLPPGGWKSTMFYIFTVSTISTLLINGNPFLRYDGYYILCDLLNIENLMGRSVEYVKQWWRWNFLKLGSRPTEKNGLFFLFFGICLFFYRIFLYTSIILLIYHKFVKSLAIVMMFMELYSILIYPCWREIQMVRMLSKHSVSKARFILLMGIFIILVAVLFLPLAWNITIPGETVPAMRQLISVPEAGYLVNPLPRQARLTQAGDLLFKLRSPQLEFALARLGAMLKYDRMLYEFQLIDEKAFSESLISIEKIATDLTAQQELLRCQKNLEVRSPTDGIFVPTRDTLTNGAFLAKGAQVGELVSKDISIHAYAQDRVIGKLQLGDTARVRARDELTWRTARITAVNKLAARLDNSPLLQIYGGPIPVYMPDGNSHLYSSVFPLYCVELSFDASPDISCGRVVSVEVHHVERLGVRIWKLFISALHREF